MHIECLLTHHIHELALLRGMPLEKQGQDHGHPQANRSGLVPSTTSYTARSIAEIPAHRRHVHLRRHYTQSAPPPSIFACCKTGAPPGSKLKGNSEWSWDLAYCNNTDLCNRYLHLELELTVEELEEQYTQHPTSLPTAQGA